MNRQEAFNQKMWRKYVQHTYLLMHGNLDEFEKEFIATCWKQCLQLSSKQIIVLERIIRKNFG